MVARSVKMLLKEEKLPETATSLGLIGPTKAPKNALHEQITFFIENLLVCMGLYDPHQPTKHFFLFILHVHKTAIHGNFHANQTQILTRETFVLFSVLFNYLSDYVQINILHLL